MLSKCNSRGRLSPGVMQHFLCHLFITNLNLSMKFAFWWFYRVVFIPTSPLTPFPIWYDWNDNYLQWTKTCGVSVSLYVKLWKDWIANYNRVVFSSERLPVSYLVYNRRPPRHWTARWQLYKDVCQPCLRRFFLNARVNFFKMTIVDMVLHISYVAWTLSYNFMRTCTADTFDDLTEDWIWQYR